MKNKGTIQNFTIGALGVGTALYAYKTKKGFAMGTLLVLGSLVVGYIVGGYAETVLTKSN